MDDSRQHRLFEDHYGRVYRFAYRLCGDRTKAEDLTMDTFAAAWEGRSRFEGRSSIQTWLFRIALYKWRELRSRDRWQEPAAEADLRVDPPSEDEMILSEAIDSLDEALREAFLLVRVEGLKYREAAGVLGIPIGTVQTRVHQASNVLRRRLYGAYGTEEKP